jgi:hypothetical protein
MAREMRPPLPYGRCGGGLDGAVGGKAPPPVAKLGRIEEPVRMMKWCCRHRGQMIGGGADDDDPSVCGNIIVGLEILRDST